MENRGKPVTTSVPSISIKFHANAEQLEEFYGSDDERPDASGGEPESSPLKYFPRLVKRSTSIDITPTTQPDASPPSDPWRFFSDIKGKITKSVEEKITEIKSRNQDEGSPLKKSSKDNSSLSDSESESSISKTCGIVSTTEGAEMSSDDETPSIDRKIEEKKSGLRQRFRLLKNRSSREGCISRRSLAGLYNINADKIEQALVEETEIESGLDALLEEDKTREILQRLEQKFDNIEIDNDSTVNVKEVTGDELKQRRNSFTSPTVFAPVGFVDLRSAAKPPKTNFLLPLLILLFLILIYVFIHSYSSYFAGFMVGVLVTCSVGYAKHTLDTPTVKATNRDIVLPAIQEYQPITKYEGWINEFPEVYNPLTYHISQTQSVYLRLQGNLLRMSHTRTKVAKRALWNEPKIKPIFTHHRVYNLLGAQVTLLPEGLAKKRHWSKKYPICVTLNKDQMDFEGPPVKDTKEHKKRSHTLLQRFSKLSEDNEEFDLESDSSQESPEDARTQDTDVDVFEEELDWHLADDDSPTPTRLFIFGRTDREKEDWFRRLKAAAHLSTSTNDAHALNDYTRYMSFFNKCKSDDWINTLIGRILFDCLGSDTFTKSFKDMIQRKLASIKLPYFIEELVVTELSLGRTPPLINKATKPQMDDRGLWIDLDVTYEGAIVLILQTKLNLMKLKQPHQEKSSERSAMFNSDVEDSAESSSDDESVSLFQNPPDAGVPTQNASGSKKFIKMVDKIAESKIFQAATEYRYIKKAMEGVSNTELRLKVELKELAGSLVLNVPPPPSDRVWVGFRPTPVVALSAHPIVGERNITFLRITSWIEKKLLLEFQKLMVIPNMEDFILPVMCPNLPE